MKNEKVTKKCVVCGNEYSVLRHRSGLSKYCGSRCSYRANYLDVSDIAKKARVLAANILGGKGKLERFVTMLEGAIGSGCSYCGIELTLKNVSLDHKTPYRSSADRRNKKENKEIRLLMDRFDNLQLVCSRCNQLKGTLTHEQYSNLRNFLSGDEDMRSIIEARLMRSSAPFYGKRF